MIWGNIPHNSTIGPFGTRGGVIMDFMYGLYTISGILYDTPKLYSTSLYSRFVLGHLYHPHHYRINDVEVGLSTNRVL